MCRGLERILKPIALAKMTVQEGATITIPDQCVIAPHISHFDTLNPMEYTTFVIAAWRHVDDVVRSTPGLVLYVCIHVDIAGVRLYIFHGSLSANPKAFSKPV